jgi:hypothetical protein
MAILRKVFQPSSINYKTVPVNVQTTLKGKITKIIKCANVLEMTELGGGGIFLYNYRIINVLPECRPPKPHEIFSL